MPLGGNENATNVLYLEVYQKILESIHSLEYIENTPLPSERYLSERYHVSRSYYHSRR
ncbi:GntR family transcriptional regulator [Acetivibrio ethanolgignens]|uniref:GntR family transcriptional regulator n=1 Tax=Acetivibrio ethanolgignens TaxID=290052 RepID=UPI0009F9854E